MLCAAARERKVAAEGSAHETVDDDAVYAHTTTEDDAIHSSFEDWCTLKVLSSAAAATVIFGEDDGAESKRLRAGCETWAGRRLLDRPAVQEAAKRVRARAPSRPRPA